MARLHEYQGKPLLSAFKIAVPRGGPAHTSLEAEELAREIDGEVVIKAQAWVTGRAALGAIKFAATPTEAAEAASTILGMQIKNFTVDTVMVEEKLAVQREFYAGVIIDDQAQAPALIFSNIGGSGIEEIAAQNPDAVGKIGIDIRRGLLDYQARDLIRKTGIHGKLQMSLGNLLVKLYDVARYYNARAAEINPIVLTEDGKLYAADCRITIDDNAVYRFPELGIEIAREFDRPPTTLERVAWEVEKNDYRGTFYFIQMEQNFQQGDGVIGFHGAGGGGSMMSMDAVLNKGYKLANFVDTSGNPPASKVYRTARIILAQGEIDGYFASGSGVASQEQFHSARGLVKAFLDAPLTVPAVIRLGGNAEERAIAILERAAAEIPAPLEAYGKDDSPEFCAVRLDKMLRQFEPPAKKSAPMNWPQPEKPYSFDTVSGGTVTFDHALCAKCESKICIETCVPGILELEDGLPILNISREEAQKGRCIECLACEVECYFEGKRGGRIVLPIPGLEG
ncbi:MAG: acetate--CoA ligase family protein [Anaerolineales bacterium]|nr:acetate--CoA ligase family protein [Anaerolineales bacterium]